MLLRPIALLALVAVAGGCLDGAPGPTTSPPTTSTSAEAANETREMYITASDVGANPDGFYALRPETFSAHVNERLNVTLKGAVGNQNMHTLVISEFDLKLGPVASGESKNQTFAFDRTGSFKYFCDVGNHRALGMEGTLTVSA